MANRYNFRLWDKQNKCFDKDFKIQIEPENEKNIIEDEESILMQSTGLTDKNGKEIFEGDIVEIKHELENKIIKVYNEVYYDEKKCWFILKNKNHQNNAPCSYSESKFCEVVGNIYENPNLIKNI